MSPRIKDQLEITIIICRCAKGAFFEPDIDACQWFTRDGVPDQPRYNGLGDRMVHESKEKKGRDGEGSKLFHNSP